MAKLSTSKAIKDSVLDAPYQMGAMEKWLLGRGLEYDLANLDADDTTIMSFVAEVRQKGSPPRASRNKNPDRNYIFPRVWREETEDYSFFPFLRRKNPANRHDAGRPGFDTSRIKHEVLTGVSDTEMPVTYYRRNLPVPLSRLNTHYTGEITQFTAVAPTANQSATPLIIMGIIDDGIPFAHAALREADGITSRVDAYWNQSVPGHAGETRVPFGRMLAADEINALISANNSDEDALYRAAGVAGLGEHYKQPLDRGWSHGAHTIGLMAGEWPAGTADSVRIIAVDLPSAATSETSGFGKDAFLLSALHFIFEQADAIERNFGKSKCPLIVNFSYGTTGGPRDGTSLVEAAIAELVAKRNEIAGPTVVTFPSGNSFEARLHAVMESQNFDDGPQAIEWLILPDDKTSSYLEIWHPEGAEPDDFEITLIAPDGTLLDAETRGPPTVKVQGTDPVALKDYYVSHHLPLQRSMEKYRNLRWRTVFCMAPTAPHNANLPKIPSGKWTISVSRNVKKAKSDIHLSILRDEDFAASQSGGLQSLFIAPDTLVTGYGSMNGNAGGSGVLRVAGYIAASGQPARYSSAAMIGATNGIHLSAPSERSGFVPGIVSIGTRSGTQFSASGTSVASPQAARALAMAALSGQAADFNPAHSAGFLAEFGDPVLSDAVNPQPYLKERLGAFRLRQNL